MNDSPQQLENTHSSQAPTLLVRQTTNTWVLAVLLLATIIASFVTAVVYPKYDKSIPELHYGFLVVIGCLIQLIRQSQKDPLEGKDTLEFYKDPLILLFLTMLPAGIAYLIFHYVFSADPSVELAGYLSSITVGFILTLASASHKIILKQHKVVFMHGAFFRKSTTELYENITSIALSATTNGITIGMNNGKYETYRWMGNLDTLQKLLQQRVAHAHETRPKAAHEYTLEELADQRLRGVLTDDEFTQAIEKPHIPKG